MHSIPYMVIKLHAFLYMYKLWTQYQSWNNTLSAYSYHHSIHILKTLPSFVLRNDKFGLSLKYNNTRLKWLIQTYYRNNKFRLRAVISVSK